MGQTQERIVKGQTLKEYMCLYRAQNRMRLKMLNRRRHKVQRWQALDKLGGRCVVCKERDYSKLEIDHVVAQKRTKEEHRRLTGRTSVKAALEGKESGSELQLLCKVCHVKKSAQERAKKGDLW